MDIEKLAKTSPTSRYAAWGAFVLIVAAAAYNWMVSPHTGQVLAAHRYKDTLGEVAKESESLRKITALKKEKLKELHQEFGELQGTFFTDQQAKEFLSDLQAVCIEEDCATFSIVIDQNTSSKANSADKKRSAINSHTAIIGVIGEYSSFISLMGRLQNRTQRVLINSLEMESYGEDSSKLKCIISLTIQAIPSEEAMLNV